MQPRESHQVMFLKPAGKNLSWWGAIDGTTEGALGIVLRKRFHKT
jgi:hypothetical protein